MNDKYSPLQKTAVALGYAGLLPQAFCVVLLLLGEEYRWFALTGGFGYGIMIFSFLGGIWWGQAIARTEVRSWIYFVAIAPSLICFCLYIPWAFGWEWPGPQLVILGLFLMASPFVDKKTGYGTDDWLQLRWHLSLGIGAMTVILGSVA